jgi:hypothetical protein
MGCGAKVCISPFKSVCCYGRLGLDGEGLYCPVTMPICAWRDRKQLIHTCCNADGKCSDGQPPPN